MELLSSWLKKKNFPRYFLIFQEILYSWDYGTSFQSVSLDEEIMVESIAYDTEILTQSF